MSERQRPYTTDADPGDETPADDDRYVSPLALADLGVTLAAERDALLALLWEMDDYADHLTGCATKRAIDPAACDCGLMEVKARAVAAWEEAGYAGPGLPWTYPPADTDRRT